METTTVNYKGVDFDIEYDYQPYESPERGPEAQYPGCAEQAEIYEIKHQGTCFLEILEDDFEELENLILEQRHEN